MHDERVVISAARFDALIFDMDGVITDTARLHRAVWKRLFDAYLRTVGEPGRPIDEFTDLDYLAFVDGRVREEGVETFLASRGIRLPRGGPDDASDAATVWGLANHKNELFLELLAQHGVDVFESTIALARDARSLGLRTAIVTASQNARIVLDAAGATALFEDCVDGTEIARLELPGKPHPAAFLEAAQRLGVDPVRAVVIEDASAGVEAGCQGGFGLVIGVDRTGDPERLRERGAHAVVTDLDVVHLEPADQQVIDACALCRAAPDRPTGWTFEVRDGSPSHEGTREALFTLGNGYTATRGTASEAVADGLRYPGTYVAGVFNRLWSNVKGKRREDESIVNLPNWVGLSIRTHDQEWFVSGSFRVLHDHWVLDLADGTLAREVRILDDEGRRSRLHERRLVHMGDPHLAAQQLTIVAENWSGPLTIRSILDGDVENGNVDEYAQLASRHLEIVDTGGRDDTVWIVARTTQSQVRIAQALRTRLPDAPARRPKRSLVRGDRRVAQDMELDMIEARPVVVEKVRSLFTSRDVAISEPRRAALEALDGTDGFEQLLAGHRLEWDQLWQRFRLTLGDEERAQLVLNLHLFHLLQTLSPHTADLDAGVPARGLHGEGYRGHYFWDELFVFGLLNLRSPQLTRELLLYRWRRLPAARRLAHEAGHRGARYPWQAGSDGREETPRELFNPRSNRWVPDNSRRQYHVNLAVAYNVWQYWQISGDLHFLTSYGTELLVEIARFWASLAVHDPSTDRFELRGVMGPDEFHDGYPDRPGGGVDNNAYTNVMVAWLMHTVRRALPLVGPRRTDELFERLSVNPAEPDTWEHMSRRMLVPHHDNGVISQFSGYEQLRELDWDDYRARYPNIGRLDLILEAEGDSPNRYQASKQADVLMLFYLFSADELRDIFQRLAYELAPEQIPRTIDYYLERTSHGSTLSRVVHSWVLARSDRAHSWSLFREALEADIADTQGGTTREGIHLGAMAGTADIMQRCYTGLEVRDDVLFLNPLLPPELGSLDFDVHYRGQWLSIAVDHRHVTVTSAPTAAAPVRIGLRDEIFEIAPGDHHDLRWSHPSEPPSQPSRSGPPRRN